MTTKSVEAANGTSTNGSWQPRSRRQPPPPRARRSLAWRRSIWAERGWPEGSPEQDWLRAEQELKTAS